MSALHHTRCFNHAAREAVARCPGCRRFYCRECVTEHDDRLMCATCLAGLSELNAKTDSRWRGLIRVGQAVAGLAFIWLMFLLLGQALLQTPSQFHEGVTWRENWWDEP